MTKNEFPQLKEKNTRFQPMFPLFFFNVSESHFLNTKFYMSKKINSSLVCKFYPLHVHIPSLCLTVKGFLALAGLPDVAVRLAGIFLSMPHVYFKWIFTPNCIYQSNYFTLPFTFYLLPFALCPFCLNNRDKFLHLLLFLR